MTVVLLSLFALGLPAHASASEGCPNEDRRIEQSATFLGDCRAWEMVSPPDKKGADVAVSSRNTMAAQELAPGESMAAEFSSLAGFGDVAGSQVLAQYMGIRDGAPGTRGWTTHSIMPRLEATTVSALVGGEQRYQDTMSPDLSQGLFMSWTPLTSEDPNVSHIFNLYEGTGLRDPGGSSYKLLTSCPGCSGPLSLSPALLPLQAPFWEGAASDLGHIIFASQYRLTADTPECGYPPELISFCSRHLFESDHGVVRLAGILPDGNVAAMPVSFERYGFKSWPHRMSNDGSRFTFESGGELYERIGNGTPNATTIDISESERTDCNVERKEAEPNYVCTGAPEPDSAPTGAKYLDASADGKRVIFSSKAMLSDDARPGVGHEQLYLYSTEAPAGHRLIALESSFVEPHLYGVIGVDDDAKYVYFVDGLSIYVWHDDGTPTGHLTLIGKISGEGHADLSQNYVELENVQPNAERESAVTPDGKHMVFVMEADPRTGEPLSTTRRLDEVWLYDAESGALHCVSCASSGVEPTGSATTITRASNSVADVESAGASEASWMANHPLTSDGRLVFFSSPDALVPQDVNGKVDAYEYDARTGSVHLLSGGQSASNSFFLDANASGSDALIATHQRLVGWDEDESSDLYDVRVGGGFPNPPVPALECDGESCQTQSIFSMSTPASANFSGEGNVVVAAKPAVRSRSLRRCSNGYVRHRVKGRSRCVRRHTNARRSSHHGKRRGRTTPRVGGR